MLPMNGMKILQIFNRYAHMGGEEIAVEQISADLSANHEFRAITFDSQEWANETGLVSRMRQFFSMVWNPASIRTVRQQIEEFRPDVVLLHNIMPVGSAGLFVYLTGSGVALVHFIHNFRPFSVNGYCWGNGRLLPEGLRKNFLPEILAGAWQNSRFKTAWYGLLIWSLHQLGVYRRIHGWIAISQFMKSTFVDCGINEDRIRVISHSWQPQCREADLPRKDTDEGDPMILFLGRLTEEKGILVLLDAWEILETSSATGSLVIAGDGPLAAEVDWRCRKLTRATYVGFKSGEDKQQLLQKCTALVVPSVWWEPLGLVLYEAYDHSKPVLAARSGGIVDHVEDGVTGWMHPPGDVKSLAAHLREAMSDRESSRTRGANGRKLLLERSSRVWIDEFNDFVGEIVVKANSRKRSKEGGRDSNIEHRTPEEPVLQLPAARCLSESVGEKKGEPVLRSLAARSVSESAKEGRKAERVVTKASSPTETPKHRNTETPAIRLTAYLADQNPGHDRSFGISRMSQVVLEALHDHGGVVVDAIVSRSSQQAPSSVENVYTLPWGTRRKWIRLITDHFHPLFNRGSIAPNLHYFPKGYLPLLSIYCKPSVVTIHDTIIQYDEDHYPEWRNAWEYRYWAMMLKHTLHRADRILTVSESSKRQILDFMARHRIPRKPITVTYESCPYEHIPQPAEVRKENYVIHLASCEPHKRTAHLVRWWSEAEASGKSLPMLHLIGAVPPEVQTLLAKSRTISKRPFLEDEALQAAYMGARALILPSEIEGFGLPALESYYLGTPVCFVKGTSVEEVLGVATDKGGFSLESSESLFTALDEIMSMPADEVRECGLKLRDTYASKKVAKRMVEVFREVAEDWKPACRTP